MLQQHTRGSEAVPMSVIRPSSEVVSEEAKLPFLLAFSEPLDSAVGERVVSQKYHCEVDTYDYGSSDTI